MENIKTELIESLLKTFTYDDMTKEQMELVVKYETEKWKPKVDELKATMTNAEIKDQIHDWWLDYEIADGTEDNLLSYIEG